MALKDCKPAELKMLGYVWARRMRRTPSSLYGSERQARRAIAAADRAARAPGFAKRGLEALKAMEAAGAIVVAVKRRAIYVVDPVETRGAFKGAALERFVLRRADLQSKGGRFFENAREHPAWAQLEALQRAKRRAR